MTFGVLFCRGDRYLDIVFRRMVVRVEVNLFLLFFTFTLYCDGVFTLGGVTSSTLGGVTSTTLGGVTSSNTFLSKI